MLAQIARELDRPEASVANTKEKKGNAVAAYLRSTRAELRKVRWPTLEQGWAMTKIVLVVTFAMAIFLGVLDFFFGWLLGQVIGGNVLFMVLGAIIAAALIGAVYLVGQSDEV
jgi:preprotein translocase subunit SecE